MTTTTFHWIPQPTSTTCGQTVMAMATGVPVIEVGKKLGRSGKTYSTDYAAFLEANGWVLRRRFEVNARDCTLLPTCPAIVRIRYVGRRSGHLVLWTGDRFLDPASASEHPIAKDPTARIDWIWPMTREASAGPVKPPPVSRMRKIGYGVYSTHDARFVAHYREEGDRWEVYDRRRAGESFFAKELKDARQAMAERYAQDARASEG